jgi:hypothetical protein
LEASLVYRVSSRTTQRIPVSKNKNKQEQEQARKANTISKYNSGFFFYHTFRFSCISERIDKISRLVMISIRYALMSCLPRNKN